MKLEYTMKLEASRKMFLNLIKPGELFICNKNIQLLSIDKKYYLASKGSILLYIRPSISLPDYIECLVGNKICYIYWRVMKIYCLLFTKKISTYEYKM